MRGARRKETKIIEESHLFNAEAIEKDKGLTIIVKDKRKNVRQMCFNSNYQVFIHHPMSYPMDLQNDYDHREYIELGSAKDIIIKPKLLVTDEKLRTYSPER